MALLSRGSKGNRKERLGLVVRRGDDPLSLEGSQVVDAADGSFGSLCHGQVSLGGTQSEGGDTFRALDARDVLLGAIIRVVDDDVVATRVEHPDIVLEEVTVVANVALETKEELRSKGNVLSSLFGLQGSRLSSLALSAIFISCRLHLNSN